MGRVCAAGSRRSKECPALQPPLDCPDHNNQHLQALQPHLDGIQVVLPGNRLIAQITTTSTNSCKL